MKSALIKILLYLIPTSGGLCLSCFGGLKHEFPMVSLIFLIVGTVTVVHPAICYWAKKFEEYFK